jgi:hypothetical protein
MNGRIFAIATGWGEMGRNMKNIQYTEATQAAQSQERFNDALDNHYQSVSGAKRQRVESVRRIAGVSAASPDIEIVTYAAPNTDAGG